MIKSDVRCCSPKGISATRMVDTNINQKPGRFLFFVMELSEVLLKRTLTERGVNNGMITICVIMFRERMYNVTIHNVYTSTKFNPICGIYFFGKMMFKFKNKNVQRFLLILQNKLGIVSLLKCSPQL